MAANIVQHYDKSGNKEYPVTSSAAVGMSDGSGDLDSKLTELASNTDAKITELASEVFLTNTPADYTGCIAEMYISAPVSQKIVCKNYKRRIYVRPLIDGAASWECNIDVNSAVNFKVIELTCTTAGDGLQVGDCIGYVVFKDIDKFMGIDYSGLGIELVKSIVTDLSRSPQIREYLYPVELRDGAITGEKISDGAISFDKLDTALQDKINNSGEESDMLTLEPVKIIEGAYITKVGYIAETSGARNIIIFTINNASDLYVSIPKNGNSYSTTYAFANELLSTRGDKLTLPSEPIIGSESEVTLKLNNSEEYQYIYITYSVSGGIPIVAVSKQEGYIQDVVNKIVSKNIAEISQNVYTEGISISLPDIVSVKGDYLQIFWRSIIEAVNPYQFDIISSCQVGKHFPRYFELEAATAANNVGKTYPLTVKVRNNNLHELCSATANIHIIDNPTSPSSLKKILCVGASATAGGQWVFELSRRLTQTNGEGTSFNPTGLGLTNIEFVGRKNGTGKKIKLEATGGWTVQNYAGEGIQAYRFFVTGISQINVNDSYTVNGYTFTITEINVTEGTGNIRCTYNGTPSIPSSGTLTRTSGTGDISITYTSYQSESYNPFWNKDTARLDFKGYADRYCDGSIDFLLFHCGVNDIFGGTQSDIDNAISAFRQILTAYHSDFPNGKVIISSVPVGSPTGGFGANYGAHLTTNYYSFLKQAFAYAKKLISLCKEEDFSSYTTYCPAMEEFDSEHGYPSSKVSVNNRSSTTESRGTNAVHPFTEGYYLVSDAFYRTMCALLAP